MDKVFPYNIWKYKVPNYESLNKNLISEIYELKNNNDGIKSSNKGGWHSKRSKENFKELSKIISNIFSKEVLNENKTIYLTNIWSNINGNNCFNELHIHDGAFCSGCYYVKIPKNSGNFYIKYNKKEIKYEPENGDLYLFKGKSPHRVGKNLSNKDRISISFNFDLWDIRLQIRDLLKTEENLYE